MQATVNRTIALTDGPIACLFKIMHGQGWMTTNQIMQAAEGCHYDAGTLRVYLSKAVGRYIETELLDPFGKTRALKYRFKEGVELPVEKVKGSRKQLENGFPPKPKAPKPTPTPAFTGWTHGLMNDFCATKKKE